MSLHSLFTGKTYLVGLLVLALAVVVACGGSATDETAGVTETAEGGTGAAPTVAPVATEQAAGDGDPTPTPFRAATPTPTALPEAIATPIPTAVVTYAGVGVQGGDARILTTGYPELWDPHLLGTIVGLEGTSPLYNQVVEFNPVSPDIVIPDLAESWEKSDDGLTYTFKIHQGATWQDGVDVTAEDVAFSINRMIEEGEPRPRVGLLRTSTDYAEVIDPYTVQVNLKLASASFLRFLAVDFMKVVPKHVVESGVDINIFDDAVAGGPYRPVETVRGDFWKHERNPDYFKEGRPYFDTLTGFSIQDPGTSIAAFRSGALDYTTPILPISVEAIVALEEELKDTWKIYWQPMNTGLQMGFNFEKEPWNDTRVQGALRLATDQYEIFQAFGLGRYNIGSPFPPNSWYGHTDEELLEFPGFGGLPGSSRTKEQDVQDAIALLAEAGFDPPSTLADHPNCCELLTNTALWFPDLTQLWAAQMDRNLGLEIVIRTVDSPTSIHAGAAGDYQILMTGYGFNIADPDDYVVNVYGPTSRNWTRWRNDRFIELLGEQSKETDVEARKGILREMELMLLEPGGSPYVELHWFPSWYFMHKKVRTEAGEFVPAQTIQTVHKQEHLWFEE